MAFNSKNYLSSEVYIAYKSVYDSPNIIFDKHSPYATLDKMKKMNPVQGLEFYVFGPFPEVGDLTYYSDAVTYIYTNYICGDPVSSIKNKELFFEDFKVPLNYFTNGEIFGIKKRFESVKNQISLQQDFGWNFFNDFDESRKVSNTDDIEKIIESIFYNTYFNYFNVFSSFKSGIKIKNQIPYTTKGKVQTENLASGIQADKYNPGKGEAPNYLNISVNSYQKTKNKVLIKADAVRTSFNSDILPPKQVYFNDTKEEFLSGFYLDSALYNSIKVLKTKEVEKAKFPKFLLTSVSNKTLNDIINNFIFSVSEYFNLVHSVLKDAIISFEFFKKYASEEDIFNTAPGLGNANQKAFIKSVEDKYKDQPLLKNLSLYLKELIINLLNIVGDKETIENTCNIFLDYLEENQPEITGLYSRQELLDILIRTNLHALTLYKIAVNELPFAPVEQLIDTISLEDNVIHSNDLILEEVLVYRSLEKPTSYEDILQESNLYKTIKLEKNKKDIVQSSIPILDSIETNKKYYYCFLSQREYNIYKEVIKSIEENRLVKHNSAPTKVLELEMISTDNSTYLDYKFFIPETKEFFIKKKNFFSKFKITPSANQRVYDSETKNFFFDKQNFIKLWTKTEKPINSDDLSTGSTIKVRLSSPKTNKKLDMNLRYFLNDQINFGDKFKEIINEDIKNISNGRKYYEVFSALQPEIINSLKETINNKLIDISQDKTIDYVLDATNESFPKFFFKINNLFSQTEILDSNNPPIKGYLEGTNGLINIYFVRGGIRTLIGFKSVVFGQLTPGGSTLTIDISDLSKIQLNKVDAKFIDKENKILIEQSIKDIYGFEYIKQTNVETKYQFPDITAVTSPPQVKEGDTITFEIATKNIVDNTKLDWEATSFQAFTNASDFTLSKGSTVVINNRAFVDVKVKTDLVLEPSELFQLKVSKNFGGGLEMIVKTSDFVSIIDKTPTFKIESFFVGPGLNNLINTNIIEEGNVIRFVTTTTNFDGFLNWKITNTDGSLTNVANNFIDPVSGQLIVNNNSSIINLKTLNNQAKQGDKTFNFVLSTPAGDVKKLFTIKDLTVVQTQTSTNPNVIGTAQQQLPASNQAQAGGAAFASGAGTGLPAGVGTPASQPTPAPTPQPTPTIPKCGYVPLDGKGILDKVVNDKIYDSYEFGFGGFKTYKPGTFSPTDSSKVKLKQGQVVVLGKTSGGAVWGSDPYTSDSDWGMAAVHAGLIKPGEKAIIEFTTQGELPGGYTSSTKFGVTTNSYNKLWCGFKIKLITLVD